MIAFWENPFEKFLLLDANTCMWGNITKEVDWENHDLIVDQPQYTFDEYAVNTRFFDTAALKAIDPEFSPEKFKNSYFCTGVLFSKRGVFELDWYKQLFRLNKGAVPVFKFGEMGLLNSMIFKSADTKNVKVKNQYFQHICPDFSKAETKKLFPFHKRIPAVSRIMVVHYNGNTKPFMQNFFSYHQPMTFFRKFFSQLANPDLSGSEIRKLLLTEDKKFATNWPLKERVKYYLGPLLKYIYRH